MEGLFIWEMTEGREDDSRADLLTLKVQCGIIIICHFLPNPNDLQLLSGTETPVSVHLIVRQTYPVFFL